MFLVDITNDFEEIEKAFIDLEQEMGPPYMIMNCAGNAVCGKLEDTSTEDIKVLPRFILLAKINYLASIEKTRRTKLSIDSAFKKSLLRINY